MAPPVTLVAATANTSAGAPATAAAPVSETIVLRINIPILKLQKALRVQTGDLVWSLSRQIEEKAATDIKDVLNYGLFVHGNDGKKGKYLDERNSVGSYHLDQTSQIDFILKQKIGGEPDSKKQKRLMEEIKSGNLDKVKEKTTKTTEFNYLIDGETPMSVAAMNNDAQMIMWLMDNGAFLDFRTGDKDQWKTPLHLAALHNKPLALKTLVQFGAWIESKDTLGLTPLYYAAGSGNSECVLRLLLAKADTEIIDEHGRNVLHQAAMNNYDCIVALLLDFGANMHHANVGGNTPLHVAASRSCKESTKWLLLRGADVEKTNKSGKKPYDVALQAACNDICDILDKFSPEQICIPPQRYIPESVTEYDGIVQNVLGSLASSIGKEYTPTLYYVKPPVTGSIRVKSVAPLRKNISSLGSSHVSMDDNNRSSQISLKLPPPPIDDSNRPTSSLAPASRTSLQTSITASSGVPSVVEGSITSKPSVALVTEETSPHSSSVVSSGSRFDIAWRKISPNSQNPPKSLEGLKKYIASSSGGPQVNDLLGDLDDLENNCVRAADEMDALRRENEALQLKLKQLEIQQQ